MRIIMVDHAKREAAALIRAVLAFGRRLRAESASGRVTSSASSMLNTLQVNGPMPARQLAREERLQPQSLTRIVKRLEDDGLIVRTRSDEDQRELIIALTPLGAGALDADLMERGQWLVEVVSDALGDGDRALLADVSRILLKLAFHDADSVVQGASMPDWVQYAVFWHVYPLGFVGAPKVSQPSGAVEHRLERIVDWLDYAVELGASALLLGPIFASSTHGYDTVDHFRIDPRLGDEADFDRLIAAAGRRGLHVVLDGVFNHVGRAFPLFAEAEAKGPGSEAARWFRPLGDGDYATFEGHRRLVALNHDNEAVADYVVDVMTHWMDRGVAGWRLDAAYATPRAFWTKVLPRVRHSHPDAYVFGEVIHGDYAGFVRDTGMDAVTQYELWKAVWSSLDDGNFFELAWALDRHNGFLDAFVPLTFVGNHDVTRIASQLTDDRHLPHALALLFMSGGVPCVYYGDEQGFRAVKGSGAGADDALRPAFPDEPAMLPAEGVPIYRLHQDLIGLRRRNPWLVRARSEAVHLNNRQMVIKVHADGNRLILALNLADDAVRLPAGGADSRLLGNGVLERNAGVVALPGHGWAVLSA